MPTPSGLTGAAVVRTTLAADAVIFQQGLRFFQGVQQFDHARIVVEQGGALDPVPGVLPETWNAASAWGVPMRPRH
jgi:hypothetical protein